MNITSLGLLLLLMTSAGTCKARDVDLPSDHFGEVNNALDTPYDQWTWLATHNSYANKDTFYFPAGRNQPDSVTKQLNYGVRYLNPDIWLIRQKQFGPKWRWEVYASAADAAKPSTLFADIAEPQVVLGHGLDQPNLAALGYDTTKPWPTLRGFLDQVGNWANNAINKDQVVTIQFETKMKGDAEKYIWEAIDSSRLGAPPMKKVENPPVRYDRLFYIMEANPKVPAPGGRAGGWSVASYGYPTIRQLTAAKKNVVLFPPFLPYRDKRNAANELLPGQDDNWELEVQTVYGKDSLPPNDESRSWILPRSESAKLDDFTRPLCSIVHIPDLPKGGFYNKIDLLLQKWQDFREDYDRLPSAIWIDFYDTGENGLGVANPTPAGPAMFVNEMNRLWRNARKPEATYVVVPTPSVDGWSKTDVQVTLAGKTVNAGFPDIPAQAVISRTFGKESRPLLTTTPGHTFVKEGITTIRFHAVGSLGKRSDTQFLDVKIDKTPPTITGKPSRPPDAGDTYTSSVTVHFEAVDELSGIAFLTEDVVLSTPGSNQSVVGTAVDKAGNQSTFTVTGLNLGAKPPEINSELEAFAPSGKLFKYDIAAAYSPTEFEAAGLPDGLSLNTKTGAITGRVTLPTGVDIQSFNVQIAAKNHLGSDSRTLVLTISRPAPLIVSLAGEGLGTVIGIGNADEPFPRMENRDIGRMITLSAVPRAGSLFNGWTGDVTSPSPTLTFLMKPDLELTANFVPNIYRTLGKAGVYTGFVAGTARVGIGTISLNIGSTGAFSAKLALAGRIVSFRGLLAPNGAGSPVSIHRKGLPPLVVTLNLTAEPGTDLLQVTISEGSFTASATAHQVMKSAGGLSGRYTVLFPAETVTEGLPEGVGFGALTVSATGAVRLVGSLGDATNLSAGGALMAGGTWPLYASLYQNGGAIVGSVTFADLSETDLAGDLHWFKPALQTHAFYPEGWPDGLEITVLGSRYRGPPIFPELAATAPGGNAFFCAYRGGVPEKLVQKINLTDSGKVTAVVPLAERFSLTFTPKSGFYQGRFVNPNSGSLHRFRGAVLQKSGVAQGTFSGDARRTGAADVRPSN